MQNWCAVMVCVVLFGASGAEGQPIEALPQGEPPPRELMQRWEEGLASPDAGVRLATVEDLWRGRDASAAALLLRAAGDADEAVSSRAASLVDMLQKLGIVPPIEPVRRLFASEHAFHRAAAVLIATSRPDGGRLDAEAVRALRDGAAEVREAACRYFAQHPTPSGIDPLIEALASDPVPLNRALAAEALHAYHSPRAEPALLGATRSDEALVRETSFHALITCGTPASFPRVLEASRSPDAETRRHATNVLAWAAWVEPAVRDAAVVAAVEDDDEAMREAAYYWVIARDISATNPALRRRLAAGDRSPRLLRAAAEMADAETVDAMAPLLDAEDPQVARYAMQAFARAGGAAHAPLLLGKLKAATDETRHRALAEALGILLQRTPELRRDPPADAAAAEDAAWGDEVTEVGEPTFYAGDLAVVPTRGRSAGGFTLLRREDGRWARVAYVQQWVH